MHNEALKKQVTSLQQNVTEFKQEISEKDQQLQYKDSQLQSLAAELESLQHRASDAELAANKVSHLCHAETPNCLRFELYAFSMYTSDSKNINF